jgi:5-methylcytosine-specific restriction endonuclease McrA
MKSTLFRLLLGVALAIIIAFFFLLRNKEKHTPPMVESGNVASHDHLYGERSSAWPALRRKWLQDHGECSACGTKEDLTVHHIVLFSVDPSRELDPTNLITLCEKHHFLIGHDPDGPGPKRPNWRTGNPSVQIHAEWVKNLLHR